MANYRIAELVNTLIYSVPATLIAIVLHEFAHAFVSYLCGDHTVKQDGRLSLNPLRHLDPMGTLCLIVFHMGWAKPVMVNTRNNKHKKLDFCLVALAGPIMNFLIAFVSLIFMFMTAAYWNHFNLSEYFYQLFYYIAVINVGLGVFNLIPIPPLDGSNVLFSFLPTRIEMTIRRYSRYLPMILAVLLITGVLNYPLSHLNSSVINGMWHTVLKIFGYKINPAGTI